MKIFNDIGISTVAYPVMMNGSVGMKEEQHCIDETSKRSTIQS